MYILCHGTRSRFQSRNSLAMDIGICKIIQTHFHISIRTKTVPKDPKGDISAEGPSGACTDHQVRFFPFSNDSLCISAYHLYWDGEQAFTSMTDYETYAMREQALLKRPKALQVRLIAHVIYMIDVMIC